MGIIAMLVSLAVLGFIYRRMIARDVPRPIGRKQALVPILLGVASLPLSFVFTLMFGILAKTAGYNAADHSLLAQSLLAGFFGAGLTEELAKFLMICASLRIFRGTVNNVYEYILVGAGVGFGFTLFEEFLYGFDMARILFRLVFIAAHLVFGMSMAYCLGMAKHKKINGQGSPTKEYLLAALVPVLMHTLYDACTVFNKFLTHEDEELQAVGLCIGLAGALAAFVLQIMVLLKCKKSAEKLCSLRLLPEEREALRV